MKPWPDSRATGGSQRLPSPRDIERSGLCVGCGSCASRMRWDKNGFLKPATVAVPNPSFSLQCPFSPAAPNEDLISEERFANPAHHDHLIGRFEAAYVGHVAEPSIRQEGSSGGLTSWTAAELLRTGRVDGIAHVVPSDPASGRHFTYRISRTVDELRAGVKSRYYPVDLSHVLAEIRSTPGRYAVVGVPCFIKAIHLLRRIDALIEGRVTHTLGLFCGHMKSAALIESFAWQLGTELARVRALDYRVKDSSRPANWYRARLSLDDDADAEGDWWHLADGDWGAGFLQNSACDWCDDVVAETADISFGDAWIEPHVFDGRGTNVVIVRSKELKSMVDRARIEGRLTLEPVDAEFIARTQAAGLRHRRDGLAYRLTWSDRGVRPLKRVSPSSDLPFRRKLVYRLRYSIARWSHRLLRLARACRAPVIYTAWARAMLGLYQSVAWSRGRLGQLLDRVFAPAER